jgi:hypothetical protein
VVRHSLLKLAAHFRSRRQNGTVRLRHVV